MMWLFAVAQQEMFLCVLLVDHPCLITYESIILDLGSYVPYCYQDSHAVLEVLKMY